MNAGVRGWIAGGLMAAVMWAVVAGAQTTYTWTGLGNKNWTTPGNWAGGGSYPQAADTALVNATAGDTVTNDANNAVSNVTVSGIGSWTWTGPYPYTLTVGAGGFNYGGTNRSVFSAQLAGSGTLTVETPIGSPNGRLDLNNTNNLFTWTGAINVRGGTLWCSPATNMPLGSGLITFGSRGRFGRYLPRNVGSTAPPVTNAFYLQGNGLMTVCGANGCLYFRNRIDGPGQLVMRGYSMTIDDRYSGSSTFSGGTRFVSGVPSVYGTNVLGTGNARVETAVSVYGPWGKPIPDSSSFLLAGFPGTSPDLELAPILWLGVYSDAWTGMSYADWLPALDTNSWGQLYLDIQWNWRTNGANVSYLLGTNSSYQIGRNRIGFQGTYVGTSLKPCVDGVYRLGSIQTGGGQFQISNSVLTGTNAVDVITGNAYVSLMTSNDFSGPLTLHQGGRLVGYQSPSGASPFGSASGPVYLNRGDLYLVGSTSGVTVTKGGMTFSGQSLLELAGYAGSPTQAVLSVATLTRAERGMLAIQPWYNALGTREKFIVAAAGGVPTNNNMAAPWFTAHDGSAFLNYDDVNGFSKAAFTKTSFASGVSETDIVNITAAGTFEEVLMRVLLSKIRLFELVIGEIDSILAYLQNPLPIEQRIGRIILESPDMAQLSRRMEQLADEIQAAQAAMEQDQLISAKILDLPAERTPSS